MYVNAQNISSFESLQLNSGSYWNGKSSSYGSFETLKTDSIFSFKNRFRMGDYGWGYYESWSGFAYSKSGNDSTAGFTNDYSAITGGGVSGSENYAVYYTGSDRDTVWLSVATKLDSMFVTNATYPYLSMKDGDMFAKKFGGESGNDKDWFMLTIRGLKDGMATDTIAFYLADYRFQNNAEDYILDKWTKVDLSVLDTVDMLEFSLSSSDTGDYGMNTPGYFCIDNMSGADFEDLSYISGNHWKGKTASFGSYASSFTDGNATFPNVFSIGDYGWGITETWSGFAYSNMKDDTTAGFTNQYSAYPAAGVDSSDVYVLCYNSMGTDSVIVSPASAISGAYFTNGTYPYLSMKNGDGVAKKFGGASGTDPDWFKLEIIGMNNGLATDTIEYYLADFRFENEEDDYIVDQWEWVDFSGLGTIDKVLFSLSSSDVGTYGMNTPAYFFMDNFNGNAPAGLNTPFTRVEHILVYPNPFASALTISSEKPIRDIRVFDMNGRILELVQVSGNRTELELSLDQLNTGVYFVQVVHGNAMSVKKVIKH